ncbi:MAG: hypothetical protein GF330_09660 [Candidatus Eisenbacteria bacterium]|nr:hypothetical protein [Candidatus Eisenbacteria bacterium]
MTSRIRTGWMIPLTGLRAAPLMALLGLALLGTPTAGAEEITWNNTAGGNWNTAANWDPLDVPNEAGEAAIVPHDGSLYTIVVDSNFSLDLVSILNPDATLEFPGRTLTLYEPGGLINDGIISALASTSEIEGNIFNNAGGEFQIHAGGLLDLRGPTITNQGIFVVNPEVDGANANLRIRAYDVSLEGSGEWVLQGPAHHDDAQITEYFGSLVQQSEHTIRGSGRITLPLTNYGAVTADEDGAVLLLDSHNKTNHGILSATNNGILQFGSGTTTQGPAGTLLADGGIVSLVNARLSGGIWDTANGGRFECYGTSYADSFTNYGQVDIPSGQVLRLNSQLITNDGVITVNSEQLSGDAIISIDEYGLRLDGTGEILMQTAGDDDDARLQNYFGSMIQGPDHTIRGDGKITTPLTNEGTIQADAPGLPLTIEGDKTNQGLMTAANDGVLVLNAQITQDGSGLVLADGGTVHLIGGRITGGTFDTSDGGVVTTVSGGTAYVDDITNDGQIEIVGNSTLGCYGAQLLNEGTIVVNADAVSGDAQMQIRDYGLLLTGSGEVRMQTAGDPRDARLNNYFGSLVHDAGHTIRGEGEIECSMENRGTVSADVAALPLQIDATVDPNRGVLEARAGGILEIWSTVSNTETGQILADGGSVKLTGGRINGGEWTSPNGGVIETGASTSYAQDFTNQGEILIHSGHTLGIYGTLVQNNGIIRVNPEMGSGDAYLQSRSEGLRIDGPGEIVLSSAGTPNDARVSAYFGSLVLGSGHTIRGAGKVEVAGENYGMFVADVDGETFQVSVPSITNFGVLRAMNNALFDYSGAIDNQGIAEAMEGATFQATSIGLHYDAYAHTFTGGTWQIFDGGIMRWAYSDVHDLRANVRFYGPTGMLYGDYGTTEALANLHTVGPGGMLEIHQGRDYTTPGDLTIDFGGITVGEGCTFTVSGAYTQIGNDEVPVLAGLTHVNGTLTAATDPVDIQGGRLCGSGTIQNSVVAAGRTDPGASAGELTVTGDFTQTEDGTLWIELAGLNAGQYDHLMVQGDASLAGRLVVTSIEGYVPQVGDRFTILTCASRTGEFTLETGSPGEGLLYETTYYPDHIEIEITGDPSYVPEEEIAEDTPQSPSEGTQIESDEPFDTPERLPTTLGLYGRPVAGGAELVCDLPQAASLTLELFDFSGRRLAMLAEGRTSAGRHRYVWNGQMQGGARAGSGVYFARARVAGHEGEQIRQTRLVLVR